MLRYHVQCKGANYAKPARFVDRNTPELRHVFVTLTEVEEEAFEAFRVAILVHILYKKPVYSSITVGPSKEASVVGHGQKSTGEGQQDSRVGQVLKGGDIVDEEVLLQEGQNSDWETLGKEDPLVTMEEWIMV